MEKLSTVCHLWSHRRTHLQVEIRKTATSSSPINPGLPDDSFLQELPDLQKLLLVTSRKPCKIVPFGGFQLFTVALRRMVPWKHGWSARQKQVSFTVCLPLLHHSPLPDDPTAPRKLLYEPMLTIRQHPTHPDPQTLRQVSRPTLADVLLILSLGPEITVPSKAEELFENFAAVSKGVT